MARPLSLYLHIPFCDWKCTYCDFNSYAGLDDLIPAFTRALLREIEISGPRVAGRPVETIFFGGGTPSLLPIADLEQILGRIRDSFGVTENAEISLEANPGTVDREKLEAMRGAGINRLSFGVQSFDDAELKFLTRIHDAETAMRAYEDARAAGFDNINLDFIFGLPGQTQESWQHTLDRAIELRPEHLSLYILTVEDNTPLGHDVARGRVAEADPDFVAGLYESTCGLMSRAGYEQYEISNWSLPGRQCRHNLTYWRNGDYLGLGPGAHAHVDGKRFAVVRSPQKYIRTMGIEAGAFPLGIHEQVEEVSAADDMADSAWLALRLNEGLDLQEFAGRHGREFAEAFPGAARYIDEGLLERVDGRLRLTARGRLLSNEVFAALVGGSPP
ncbi:MAG: radical SAM family heme chaperone HemW [Dehalococcoidia bacterium]